MGSGEWKTPDYFYDRCNEVWGPFGLDAAASEKNAKCELFINEEMDARFIDWTKMLRREEGRLNKKIWLNPPYKNLVRWVNKAIIESNKGLRVVMLLPNDTDTRWYQRLSTRAEIYLTTGRVRFVDPDNKGRVSPRQGHIVAVLHPPVEGVKRNCGVCGTIKAGE